MSAEVKSLILERQKAMIALRSEFMKDRGLEVDPDTWPAQDLIEYGQQVQAIGRQWRGKIKAATRKP